MRMAFGLVSLLVVVAIIAFLASRDAETASKVNKDARQNLAPITGQGSDGVERRVDKSAEFISDRKGLLVTKVNKDSYFEYFYSPPLQKGDVITTAGEMSLEGMDEGALFQMAQQKRDLTVLRNGQKMTLKQKS
jgi:hypothetical protein